MKLIPRETYLRQLEEVRGTPDIKVITGIRRCGKSVLMEEFMTRIREKNPQANIIHINFNSLNFENLKEYHALHYAIETQWKTGTENIICIDEIQMCTGFEYAINSLHASGKYDIYLTGSNAFLLASDLATLFTGRTYNIPVYPFSLSEFMLYFDIFDPQKALDRYMTEGGMPGSYEYPVGTIRNTYLKSVLSTIVERDIKEKYRLKSTVVLDRVIDYLTDNNANITSARGISAELTKNNLKTTHITVCKYIGYLCRAFIFYRMRRYDTAGKKYLSTNEKYYLCDPSFRSVILKNDRPNSGRTLEDIVAIELIRRGYTVATGITGNREIDFIVTGINEKFYIQVAETIENPETFAREYEPLIRIRDMYPKLILARTKKPEYEINGVQIIDVAEWLTTPPKS